VRTQLHQGNYLRSIIEEAIAQNSKWHQDYSTKALVESGEMWYPAGTTLSNDFAVVEIHQPGDEGAGGDGGEELMTND
jgi:hypothetical protein